MDHAVALVEAYLQINGYFTVAEYPVIESFGKKHYGVATDLDILAFRFPGAGRLVPGHGGKGMFAPDLALGIDGDTADMLIGEVKEGHAELNRNARNPEVLRHAQFKHPALGLFVVLEKARREAGRSNTS